MFLAVDVRKQIKQNTKNKLNLIFVVWKNKTRHKTIHQKKKKDF